MIEKRFADGVVELRDKESRRVEGYALVFGSESRDLGGMVEVIASGSLDGVLADSDVKCWLNHDESRGVLARRRGDISQSSFAFTVEEDKWERMEDGRAKRTILKFARLYDVSPVYEPAYYATSVDRRGLEELEEKEAEAAEAAKQAAEAELKQYYEEFKAKMNL